MTETTYNGWSNYETWIVGMFLDGNYTGQETYLGTIETVRDVYPTEESGRRYLVADALRDYVEDSLPDLGPSLAQDLLGAAFGSVDWYELADAWIENMREQAVDYGDGSWREART